MLCCDVVWPLEKFDVFQFSSVVQRYHYKAVVKETLRMISDSFLRAGYRDAVLEAVAGCLRNVRACVISWAGDSETRGYFSGCHGNMWQ